MDINEQYWGESNTWIYGTNGGYRYPPQTKNLLAQYNKTTHLQDFGVPFDISPSLWGWNKDCSWATNHTYSWSNGVKQEAICRPEISAPVLGWHYDRNNYNSTYFTTSPFFRFAYDTYGDFGEYANYDAEDAQQSASGMAYNAVPWMTLEWSAWCVAPEITVYKFDSNNGWQTKSLYLANEVDGHDLAWYLDHGWIPTSISMHQWYGADVGTGGVDHTRTGANHFTQGKVFLCGMGNIKLTQDMYDWATTELYTIRSKKYLPPDYGYDMEINQGPFTAFCANKYLSWGHEADVYDCRHACIGGDHTFYYDNPPYYSQTVNDLLTYDYCAFFRFAHTSQVFDDVSYHWVQEITDDIGGAVDPNQATTDVHIFTKLVIDSKQEGDTDAQAYMKAILHECAFFGMKFANLDYRAQTDDLTSTGTGLGLYLPLFTDDGVTTGEYKTGQDMVDDPTVDRHYIDFNPEPAPVPEDQEDIPGQPGSSTGDRTGDWTYTNGDMIIDAMNYHVVDIATYLHFMEWVKGGTSSTASMTGWVANLDYNGINASDWILCVKQFPIGIPHQASSGWDVLSVGGTTIEYNGTPLSGPLLWYKTSLCTFQLGKIAINGALFNTPAGENFLGLDNGQAFLQLPFYGDLPIDLGRYWGAEMKVESTIDFPNGIGTYYIYSGGRVFDAVNFEIGVDLPCSATQMANYQSAMHNLRRQLDRLDYDEVMQSAGAIGKLITLDIPGAVRNINDVIKGEVFTRPDIQWNMAHTKPTAGSYNSPSGFCSTRQDLTPKLIVCQPYISDFDSTAYGNQVGFACFKQGKLSSFPGYTVCSNVKFSNINATASEKALIIQQLQNGVYL